MRLIDSNLLLRLLTNDNPKQAEKVEGLLRSTPDPIFLPDVVIAEIVWVLSSFYKVPKEEIAEKIFKVLSFRNIRSNQALLIRALYFYRTMNLSFIDAYLAAYTEKEGLEGIYSFDKGFDKIESVKRFVPK